VFLDGCFWHGCPTHFRDTKSNTKWWADKIAANKQRDAETNELLAAAGWQVVRVWEHEDPAEAAERVHEAVRARTVARAVG
jgi:DNA mismatch endonuclease (patch repair protein)